MTINLSNSKHEIVFTSRPANKPMLHSFAVFNFPCETEPHNVIFDVINQLPKYTKSKTSESFFCAGYYLVKFTNGFVVSYCPKFTTLMNYAFHGPYYHKADARADEKLRRASCQN